MKFQRGALSTIGGLVLGAGLFLLGCTTGVQKGADNTAGGSGDTGGSPGSGGAGQDPRGQAGESGQTTGGAGGVDQSGGGQGGQIAAGGSGTGGSGGSSAGGTGGSAQGGSAGGTAGQGGTGPAPPPGCPTHTYCEDFENIDVGARPAGRHSVGSGNLFSVASDKAFSGKRSLFVQASGGSAQVQVTLRNLLKNPKRVGYIRMMMWLDNLPGGDGHWSVFGMSGSAISGNGGMFGADISFGGFGDTTQRFLYTGAGADCAKSTNPPVPLKKWVCLEMRADETQTNDYGMLIDTKAVGALTFPNTNTGVGCYMRGSLNGVWYVPDPDNITYGWFYWHTQGRPIKMWIDDVVVDEKPIGCPAAM